MARDTFQKNLVILGAQFERLKPGFQSTAAQHFPERNPFPIYWGQALEITHFSNLGFSISLTNSVCMTATAPLMLLWQELEWMPISGWNWFVEWSKEGVLRGNSIKGDLSQWRSCCNEILEHPQHVPCHEIAMSWRNQLPGHSWIAWDQSEGQWMDETAGNATSGNLLEFPATGLFNPCCVIQTILTIHAGQEQPAGWS